MSVIFILVIYLSVIDSDNLKSSYDLTLY